MIADREISARLRQGWIVQRFQDHGAVRFHISNSTGMPVEVGYAHEGVHIWVQLPEGWRYDTITEDVEDVVFDICEIFDLVDALMDGKIQAPEGAVDRQSKWTPLGLDLGLRYVG